MTKQRLEPTIAGHHTQWSWRPDAETRRSLNRANRKIAKARRERLLEIEGDTTMATRKTTTAKKVTAKKTAPKAKSNLTPLKTIVPEGMDTRIARRKLRKADFNGHDSKARWEFTADEVKEVKKILAA